MFKYGEILKVGSAKLETIEVLSRVEAYKFSFMEETGAAMIS